jgi:hypothetical protein
MKLPSHLGGNANQTHIDVGVLNYMKDHHHVKSMLDIGCSSGGMVRLAETLGIDSVGIDGDYTVIPKGSNFITHDYQKGSTLLTRTFDMVWSCEFVEHVHERYIENYINDFCRGKKLIMSYSENPNGYHHVNLKPESYWIETLNTYGFEFDLEETLKIREISTMNLKKPKGKRFMKNAGMFFNRMP